MAVELEFPKVDGDIYFGKDANKAAFQIYDNFEQETLSVSTVSSSVSYSAERDTHLIQNTGSQSAFINFDTAATTSDFELLAGNAIAIDGQATAIHAITSTGTTTLRIIGQS